MIVGIGPGLQKKVGQFEMGVLHRQQEGAGAAAVDQLPGGKGWREALERFPEDERHLYAHEGHLVTCTERDRANLVPELGATTFTGTPGFGVMCSMT